MIVLKGNIKLAGQTVSDYVTQFTYNLQRNTVERPGTFGKPRITQRAGSEQETLTLDWFDDDYSASMVWGILFTAAKKSTSAEVSFEGTLMDGPVSASNPWFVGKLLATDLDSGGTVNEARRQTKTFPVTEIAIYQSDGATPVPW